MRTVVKPPAFSDKRGPKLNACPTFFESAPAGSPGSPVQHRVKALLAQVQALTDNDAMAAVLFERILEDALAELQGQRGATENSATAGAAAEKVMTESGVERRGLSTRVLAVYAQMHDALNGRR